MSQITCKYCTTQKQYYAIFLRKQGSDCKMLEVTLIFNAVCIIREGENRGEEANHYTFTALMTWGQLGRIRLFIVVYFDFLIVLECCIFLIYSYIHGFILHTMYQKKPNSNIVPPVQVKFYQNLSPLSFLSSMKSCH